MELILLPGNSPKNEAWTRAVASELRQMFPEQKMHRYLHWDSGQDLLDYRAETEILTRNVTDSTLILAKSAGVLVALDAISKGARPNCCIYVGMPLLFARDTQFPLESRLEGYAVPTLFIQAEKDPLGSFQDVSHLLFEKAVSNHALKQFPGSDHRYADISLLHRYIQEYFQ